MRDQPFIRGRQRAHDLLHEHVMGVGRRSDDLHAPVVIGRRGQELVCRSTTEISVDGKPAGKVVDIQPGANVAVGSLRLVVARENVA